MSDVDYERDPALRLVTDALRAGPGSPEWHEAVVRARSNGHATGATARDEHALLYAVREHLASGRAYREVRPGAEFSRRLWGAIEEESAAATKRSSVPTANLVALASAVAIVAVVLMAGYFITRGGGDPPAAPARDLDRILFVDTAAEATFDRPPGAQWRTVGALPLAATRGAMRPVPATGPSNPPATTSPDYVGGALVCDTAVAPAKAASVETVLRLPKPGDDTIAQVFVTDDPTFSDDRSTTPSELVVLVRPGEASVVLPSGRVAGETAALKPDRPALRVKLMFDAATVAVDAGGKRLFAGEHGLRADRPRYIGVRFLARAGAAPVDPKDAPGIDSIRVMTPKSP